MSSTEARTETDSDTEQYSSDWSRFMLIVSCLDAFLFVLSGMFVLRAYLRIKRRKKAYETIKDPKERMKLQPSNSRMARRRYDNYIWFSGITSISAVRGFFMVWFFGQLTTGILILIAYMKPKTWGLLLTFTSFFLCFVTAFLGWALPATRNRIVYGLTPTCIVISGFRKSDQIRDYPIQVQKYSVIKTHWDKAQSLYITTERWTTQGRDKDGNYKTHYHSMDIGVNWIFEMDELNNLIAQIQEQLVGEEMGDENTQRKGSQRSVGLMSEGMEGENTQQRGRRGSVGLISEGMEGGNQQKRERRGSVGLVSGGMEGGNQQKRERRGSVGLMSGGMGGGNQQKRGRKGSVSLISEGMEVEYLQKRERRGSVGLVSGGKEGGNQKKRGRRGSAGFKKKSNRSGSPNKNRNQTKRVRSQKRTRNPNHSNNDLSMQGPLDLTNNNDQMGAEMIGTMDNDLEMNKF
ncbi:hypothetical protein M0812_08670 [Anaeramoeba flamelloides]|uniref:Uncharacterized protein n=1 Tax=Anaeramoeba flamelloides TaxID=1746091 RepID=A0AAV8A0P3_9EUKA|nr:hypothetical protein M0812_08670 [Anaeramoeba flamelloides]